MRRRSFLGGFAALFAIPAAAKAVEVSLPTAVPVEKTAEQVIEKLKASGASIATEPPSDLYSQIIPSLHRVETKPCEYSRALVRMLNRNPDMTPADLAEKLGKSTSWLNDRLNLVLLRKDIQELVDEGEITLSNAYALSHIREENQGYFIEEAQKLKPADFYRITQAYRRHIKNKFLINRKVYHKGPGFISYHFDDTELGKPRFFGVSETHGKALNQTALVELIAEERKTGYTVDLDFVYRMKKNQNFAVLYGN